MKNINFIVIILIIILSIFSGCAGKMPAPTATPTATPMLLPTVVPTTPAPTPVPTPAIGVPINYRVWIDSDYGFYKVRAIQGNSSLNLPQDYDVLNFTINVGDSVRWMNDDSYDFPLTIVSNEGLWTGRTGLMRWQGERFEYTFNKTGTYTFSIQEFPRIQNETIRVIPWSLIEY